MENASKALYMAGSLLIALLVIALLVYAFDHIGGVQNEKDKIEDEQSVIAFNKEFEVYNKRIMAGTDVISCINKAVSNNEKYVKGGAYFQGLGEGEERLVDVVIRSDNLDDSDEKLRFYDRFRWYYINNRGKEVEGKVLLLNSDRIEHFSDVEKKVELVELNDYEDFLVDADIAIDTIFSGAIENDNDIDLGTCLENPNEYFIEFPAMISLLDDTEGYFEQIANAPANFKITIKNLQKNSQRKWTKIEWILPLNELKKQAFYCQDILYSETTGCVNQIIFCPIPEEDN